MTTANPSLPDMAGTSRASMRALISRLWAFNWPLTLSIMLYLVLTPVYIIAAIADPRLITGAPAFVKPLKFVLSVGIYSATFLWLLTLVEWRRRWVQIAANVTSIGLMVEIVLITVQAMRGTASHFNAATEFDSTVFSIMGLVITVVAIMNLLLGIWLLFQRLPEPITAWGIRLGVLISFVGMAVAFLMTSGPTPIQRTQMEAGQEPTAIGAHSVNVEDGGPGLPFLGWSTEGGDLRVPHFIGLHAMQILPLLAFALTSSAARRRWQQGQRTALIITGGLGYLSWIVLLTWQALRGQPVLAPDALTLSAYAALTGMVALAAGVILATPLFVRSPELSTQ
jgi:hypothetical protein